jgi:hypothetical protein
MPHVRQDIRTAVLSALTGLGITGANVFAGRPDEHQLQDAELPALVVSTVDEAPVETALGGFNRVQMREFALEVAVKVKATSGWLDSLDAIAAQVETAIANANQAGGAKYMQPDGMSGPEVSAAGDRPVASAVLRWRVGYAVSINDPTTAL